MPRYRTTQITTKNNRSKYNTTLYREIPEKNSDILLITQEGDRLDNLASEYYGDPNLWWFIARVNNLKTMNLEGGLQIRIPISDKDAIGV
jgi:nucleoid-associated protein YgaU